MGVRAYRMFMGLECGPIPSHAPRHVSGGFLAGQEAVSHDV